MAPTGSCKYGGEISSFSPRALSYMLTAGAIAPVVEQIVSPGPAFSPRSENLKFDVNYVPCNLLFVKVRYTYWYLIW